ncbi:YsnF/AvaK domain-containing protein [Paenibacillus antri]|uniref:YsnF/AvaK domain-containing protein n=1 Tax=Paenibacillus antri TaxID=2582848 RepID=A0A5R9G7Z9_9BACL|nr:YsnF/AvaK domain-containing protein [Paenibacillus antri]TLS49558.1 YsnF/AvaK domain-containing protein [Paenibacillus antri]
MSSEERNGGSLPRTWKLREEELSIEKTKVTVGEVIVRKEIVKEVKTVTVPVAREELVIEETRYNENGEKGDPRIKRIPIWEERIEIAKKPVIVSEVSIYKQVVSQTETISEPVKKEILRIEENGDPDLLRLFE